MNQAIPEGDDVRGLWEVPSHFRKDLEHLAKGFADDFELLVPQQTVSSGLQHSRESSSLK